MLQDIPASSIVPIAALLVSVGILFFATFSLKQRAKNDYVETLSTKLTRSEHELEICRTENERLRDENIGLLRRVVHRGRADS